MSTLFSGTSFVDLDPPDGVQVDDASASSRGSSEAPRDTSPPDSPTFRDLVDLRDERFCRVIMTRDGGRVCGHSMPCTRKLHTQIGGDAARRGSPGWYVATVGHTGVVDGWYASGVVPPDRVEALRVESVREASVLQRAMEGEEIAFAASDAAAPPSQVTGPGSPPSEPRPPGRDQGAPPPAAAPTTGASGSLLLGLGALDGSERRLEADESVANVWLRMGWRLKHVFTVPRDQGAADAWVRACPKAPASEN